MKAGIIAGIVAMLVSTASATAAFVVTSKNIKNGTIQTIDMSTKAKRALKGNRGPRGFQGLNGTTGLSGPAGPAGPKGDKGDSGAAIAYGMIKADGSVSQATANVSSSWNSTLNRYEITISGINYHFLSHVTVVTPADPALNVIPATNSLGANILLVYFRNTSGTAVQTLFGFVTYDP